MDIKPIETYYNGYKFRSRLEARWAVFFDAGKIRYEYEPEGYTIGGKNYRYLPDFYLTDFDCHVEVKRNTAEGIREIEEKCVPAIEWGGPIKKILILSDVPAGAPEDGGLWHFPVLFWHDDYVTWGWFFFCDDIESVYGHISSAAYPNPSKIWWRQKSKSIAAISDGVLRRTRIVPADVTFSNLDFNPMTFHAYAVARQARFEHGETPNHDTIKFGNTALKDMTSDFDPYEGMIF